MNKSAIWTLAASLTLAALALTCLPDPTADAKAPASTQKAKAKPRELGGKMPLPVDQTIDRENSPSDKLVVEVTHSASESGHYVAYVKIVWGDLDNLIKGTGKQYYSNWDGSLALTGATGAIDEKIQFDDKTGKHKSIAVNPKKAAKAAEGPHEGSGRDEVLDASGPKVDWKAGVVGVLDGLRIKITSDSPNISATLTAGKFTLPLAIIPEPAPAAAPATK